MKRIIILIGFISIVFVASKLFAQKDQTEIFVQSGHSGSVSSVAISPDGKYALSSSKSMKLWDITTGREIRTFEGHSRPITSVAFSPSSKLALSGSLDNTLKLWDITTGKNLKTFSGHTDVVESVAYSHDGAYALSGSKDGNVKLWDITSGKEVRTFNDNINSDTRLTSVTSITLSYDDQYALSADRGGYIKLWDLASGDMISSIRTRTRVYSVALSHDGNMAFTGGSKDLMIWDMISGKKIRTLTGHSRGITSIVLSLDGLSIISGSYDETIKIWDITTGKLIRTINTNSTSIYSIIRSIAITQDGRSILSGSGKALKLWDIATGNEISIFKEHSNIVTRSVFSPNGQYMLCGGDDLKLWDITTGDLIRRFKNLSVSSKVDFSPDGLFALSNLDYTDSTFVLWDIASGNKIRTFKGQSFGINSLTYSPDGLSALSTFQDSTIILWDIASGEKIRTFKGHIHVQTIEFSPDGHYALSGSRREPYNLQLWDVYTGEKIRTFTGHSQMIFSIAFSPDGQYALSTSNDSTLKLWDIATGNEIRTFTGHSGFVGSVVFSQDGQYALSGGQDNTIKLWKISTGNKIRSFIGHSGSIGSVAFSQDGQRILSSSSDNTVRIWDFNTGNEIAQFITFSNDEWVVITTEGYYNASPNGAKFINVRIGNKVYSMDNYAETFYRPDLVQLALSGKSIENLFTLENIKPAPEVEIVNALEKTNKNEVEITLKITDVGGGIGNIRLYINGSSILTENSRGIKLINPKNEVYKKFNIILGNGYNIIKAIVFNEDNTMESNPAFHTILADIKLQKDNNLYAVIIGINDYENPSLTLNYANSDADLFAETINNVASGLFDNVDIKKLISKEETTKEHIIKVLTQFTSIKPSDTFVFYVASHGLVDDGNYYLLTSNVGSVSTRKLKEAALRQRELQDMLMNIPAGKKVMLFDTCNSGEIAKGIQVAMLTRGLDSSTAIKLLSRAVGSTIISASTSSQDALEGYMDHGLFTYVLSKGLNGEADMNNDGFIKTRELADYVEDEVIRISEEIFNKAQYPVSTPVGDAFPLGKVK